MINLSDEEQKIVFANNLQYYIRRTGKDQKQIALEMDIKPTTFNQWVKAKAIPAVSEIRKVACYFNIAVSDLVDPHGNKVNYKNNSSYQNILDKLSRLNKEGLKMADSYMDFLLSQEQYIKTYSEMVSGE